VKNMNNALFYSNGTSGALSPEYTLAADASEIISREYIGVYNSFDEVSVMVNTVDLDGTTPIVTPYIALYNGSGFMAWQPIDDAHQVPGSISISFYGQSWWVRNYGFRLKFVRTGTGRVGFTNGAVV